MTPANGGPEGGKPADQDHQERESHEPGFASEDAPGVGPRSQSRRDSPQQSGLPGKRRLERMAAASGSARGSAYQGASEAVLSILVATLLGYWADRHFGTEPIWLITGAIIGFCAFVLRLVRMGKLVEQLAAESDNAPPSAGTTGQGREARQQGETDTGPERQSGPQDDR